MVDKTDTDTVVLELERIALEHYAMKSLLREAFPHSWKGDVHGFFRENVRDKTVRTQINELCAAIQSSPGRNIPPQILVACLQKTNLDDLGSIQPGARVYW